MLDTPTVRESVAAAHRFIEGGRHLHEEVRVKIVQSIRHALTLTAMTGDIAPNPILECLSLAVTDPCPEVRLEALGALTEVGSVVDNMGSDLNALVSNVASNLKHNQWRIRRCALEGLSAFLSQRATQETDLAITSQIERLFPVLQAVGHDRSIHVRKALIRLCNKLITGESFEHLSYSSSRILYIIACRFSDESDELRHEALRCFEPMETHGVQVLKLQHGYEHIMDCLSSLIARDHSTDCLDIAISVLESKQINESVKVDAMRVMCIFAPLAEESVVPKIISLLTLHYSDSSLSGISTDCFRMLLVIHSHASVMHHLSILLEAGSDQTVSSVLSLAAVVLETTASKDLWYQFLDFADFASQRESLYPVVESVMTKACSHMPPTTSPDIRLRIFSILVQCVSSNRNACVVRQILGDDIFDKVFNDCSDVTDPGELKVLLANVSFRLLEPKFESEIMPEIVNFFSDSNDIEAIISGLELVFISCDRGLVQSELARTTVAHILTEKLKWGPSQTQNKTRKLALVVLQKFLRHNPCPPLSLQPLIDMLQDCSEDCWSPDNRLLALWCLDDVGCHGLVKARIDDTNAVIRDFVKHCSPRSE